MRRLFALLVWLAPAVVAPLAPAQTYLVAPFTNRTKVTSYSWLGWSLAESVRETLAEEGFATVSREDREDAAKKLALKPPAEVSLASLAKLCGAAGAERLMYGHIELFPDAGGPAATAASGSMSGSDKATLRVTVRALDVKDVVQIGEFFESGPVQDLAAIETDLAWKIQGWARPERQVTLEEFRRRHPAVKNIARESYVRGLMARSAEERHRLLTQAARLDSTFAQPVFVLGREHFLKGDFREAAGWLDKVPPRNLNYIESRFLLALSRYHLSEFAAARGLLEQLSPQLPVPELWNNLGAAQARLNEPPALDSFKRALEGDPADTDYQFNVGYTLWKRGDFEPAAGYFRAVLDASRGDQDAIQLLGRCLKKSGPRAGDWRTEGLERLKETYEEPGPH